MVKKKIFRKLCNVKKKSTTIMFLMHCSGLFLYLEMFQNVKHLSISFEYDSPPPLGKFRSQGLATLAFTAFLEIRASV